MSTIKCDACKCVYTEVTEVGLPHLNFCSNCGTKLPTPPARQQATHGQAWEAGMRWSRSRLDKTIYPLLDGDRIDGIVEGTWEVASSPLGPWVEPLFPFVEG
jgi:hypothetical protein